MHKLLLTSAIALALIGGAAYAQQTSTSDATSGAAANQGQVQAQGNNNGSQAQSATANNGGQNIGPTTVGSDISKSNANSNAVSGSASIAKGGNSDANAANGSATSGNQQGVQINNLTPSHQELKTAPEEIAPALTTTLTDTCMGSTSAGGSWMGGGFTLGTSWEDKGCTRRLNAREVANLTGDREAARAILCQDKMVREAFEKVGRPCPGEPGYAQVAPQSYEPAPPPPPPAPPPINFYSAPPPTPPAAEEGQPAGTMAPIPNPPETGPLHTPRN